MFNPGAAPSFAAFRMPGDYVRHDDIDEQQAKRHQPMQMQLPPPLTEQLLSQAMRELNQGTARAVESCLQCYRSKRMSGSDLLSFARSIAVHSTTLSTLFQRKQVVLYDMGEAVGDDDFAALMALAGAPAPVPCVAACYAHMPASPSPAVNPLPISMDSVFAPSTKPRIRKPKVLELSNEVLLLMQRWREKRVTEIARRQHETAKCRGVASAAKRNAAYVRFLMGKLVTTLPVAGSLKLLDHVRTFNASMDIASFSERIKDLVDEFSIKISLSYPLECTVRAALAPNARAVAAAAKLAAAEAAAVAAIDIDGDLDFDGKGCWPSVQPASATASSDHSHYQAGCSHGSGAFTGKRKRTETLNGAHPEDEDDMACCPVCHQDEARDDDRWVKCDGCGSWYHQICVLFNEIAHGKSVRFFCRTPGCRKRGSRQLNCRQRKPCYPTSPNIESSSLADTMTAMVQPVARGDRSVVIKMVANVESVLEVKGSRSCRKSVERCRKKTICAFQHTLIGSDLLFMVMFVEEIVGPDGVGRVEIRKVDVNGFYEELQHNEASNVEKAIVQSYLSHAANAGFASARVHVGGKQRSLFLGAPASQSVTASVNSCMNVLEEARNVGLVHSFQQERCDGSDQCVIVQLLSPSSMASAVATERDSDIACPVAQTLQDWMQVQEQHGYKFDDLQFAKFSSMMMVYHMIKGWKKEFTAPPRQITLPCSDPDTPPPPRAAKIE
eukprot:CAMPEP_0173075290 /NCGR_PEP_ID=MMETSP1102-20130122/11556_1 /TAXON_ID=49646 /ORGANISM="Geminigera sp., Strain Caron Lab Isolate" /LENGTH=724 /DNA_ID=CAMNT_0013944585 /DNA_START=175 /DNA_END=2346 /DNA_ORIENTATION=-